MAERGIASGVELARLSATYQPTISDWLNGRSGLSKEVGRRVANVLGVSLETVLFDWAPKRRRRKKRSG